MSGADTSRRRAAAARVASARTAQSRQCPRCLRRAALGQRVRWPGGHVRVCNYCGHEVGISDGKTFGRPVMPEPGARGGPLLPLEGPPPVVVALREAINAGGMEIAVRCMCGWDADGGLRFVDVARAIGLATPGRQAVLIEGEERAPTECPVCRGELDPERLRTAT